MKSWVGRARGGRVGSWRRLSPNYTLVGPTLASNCRPRKPSSSQPVWSTFIHMHCTLHIAHCTAHCMHCTLQCTMHYVDFFTLINCTSACSTIMWLDPRKLAEFVTGWNVIFGEIFLPLLKFNRNKSLLACFDITEIFEGTRMDFTSVCSGWWNVVRFPNLYLCLSENMTGWNGTGNVETSKMGLAAGNKAM